MDKGKFAFRRFIFPFLLLMVLTPLAAAYGMEGKEEYARIELRPEAVVEGKRLTLGDVAVVHAQNRGAQESLSTMAVGHVPRTGYVERLSRGELEQAIRTRLASRIWKIEWTGPQAVKIRAAAQTLDAQVMKDIAKKYVIEALSEKFQKVEVEQVSQLEDIDLPLGKVDCKPRPIEMSRLRPRLPLWLDVFVDGNLYRSVVVPLRLHLIQSVYVARRDLSEGASLAREDFEVRMLDVSEMAPDVLRASDSDSLRDARLKKPLPSGQSLTAGHVVPSGSVLRGDLVRLVLAEGGVSVEADAIAQQGGGIGQRIRVKPGHGMESLLGRIVAPGVVRVEER